MKIKQGEFLDGSPVVSARRGSVAVQLGCGRCPIRTRFLAMGIPSLNTSDPTVNRGQRKEAEKLSGALEDLAQISIVTANVRVETGSECLDSLGCPYRGAIEHVVAEINKSFADAGLEVGRQGLPD